MNQPVSVAGLNGLALGLNVVIHGRGYDWRMAPLEIALRYIDEAKSATPGMGAADTLTYGRGHAVGQLKAMEELWSGDADVGKTWASVIAGSAWRIVHGDVNVSRAAMQKAAQTLVEVERWTDSLRDAA